jgi:hypothetical protein
MKIIRDTKSAWSPEYTAEMRARSEARIAKKLAQDDTQAVYSRYMNAMYNAFIARVKRAAEGRAGE